MTKRVVSCLIFALLLSFGETYAITDPANGDYQIGNVQIHDLYSTLYGHEYDATIPPPPGAVVTPWYFTPESNPLGYHPGVDATPLSRLPVTPSGIASAPFDSGSGYFSTFFTVDIPVGPVVFPLRMDAFATFTGSVEEILLNGHSLAFTSAPLGPGDPLIVYSVEIKESYFNMDGITGGNILSIFVRHEGIESNGATARILFASEAVTPEPATCLLLGLGLGVIPLAGRFRKKR